MTKTNPNYGKLTATLIGAWFILSLTASALHVFSTDPSRPPIPLGVAALAPIVLFLLWFATSDAFRQFVLALDPRTLTFLQAWRIAGLTFLALYTYGLLPGLFALPAGWGDIAIGATAPLVATRLANPAHRKSFILWQLLGIADLVTAVTIGHDRPADRTAWDRDQPYDRAPSEPDSDFRRTLAVHPAHHLHRASSPLARTKDIECRRAIGSIGMIQRVPGTPHLAVFEMWVAEPQLSRTRDRRARHPALNTA